MLVNNAHKKAAKAAIARLMVKNTHPQAAAVCVLEAAETLGMQLGDLHNVVALEKYALGIQGQASNRLWEDYGSFHKLVDKLAKQAGREWEEILLQ